MTKIAICADDYALSPGIDEATWHLAMAGRITATSCITVLPRWRGQARELRNLIGKIDIGLHLTLTDHSPIGAMPVLASSNRFPTVEGLLSAGLRGAISRQELYAEINRQIDAFEEALGVSPDFLDGHHHVHQFPGIREVVVEVFLARLAPKGAYMRTGWDQPSRILCRSAYVLKAMAIALLGRNFNALAERHSIKTNRGFSGVYDFSNKRDYGDLFKRFIRYQRDGGLVMCHPALADDQLATLDSVVASRQREYHWLASDHMKKVLEEAGVELCRLSELLNDFPQPC